MAADLHFYLDPVCPYSWLTSQWVRSVAASRSYEVEWRFMSLRLLNRQVDYDAHFPPEAEGSHTAGLHLLRLAARTRAEHGVSAVGSLYASLGAQLWQGAPDERDLPSRVEPVAAAALADCGLPPDLSGALSDSSWDAGLRAETDSAVALAGNGVGTPVLHFSPPHGVAFCGPVITRLPEKDRAVELWDSVVALAGFRGFTALQRSALESPQLPAMPGLRPP